MHQILKCRKRNHNLITTNIACLVINSNRKSTQIIIAYYLYWSTGCCGVKFWRYCVDKTNPLSPVLVLPMRLRGFSAMGVGEMGRWGDGEKNCYATLSPLSPLSSLSSSPYPMLRKLMRLLPFAVIPLVGRVQS
jgi:hypothetical protein